MNFSKCMVILLALACIAIFSAGCTSSQPAHTPAAPAAPASPQAAVTTAAPAPSTTPECPDKYEKGVWDYSWDTRWMGYAGNHDIRSIADGQEGQPDSWNGINAPPATDMKLSQMCWDVTGTVAFATDPVCTGTVTGKIDKNQLNGVWKTTGCEAEEGSSDGKFFLTMAADNKTWTGKIIGTKWLDWCSDCPPNWAGRRV
ncbi:MAG: hypothetical protein Q8R70_12155 [Methanoregula sp.]|nr:hypothetical protein [Methanoregula sp.]